MLTLFFEISYIFKNPTLHSQVYCFCYPLLATYLSIDPPRDGRSSCSPPGRHHQPQMDRNQDDDATGQGSGFLYLTITIYNSISCCNIFYKNLVSKLSVLVSSPYKGLVSSPYKLLVFILSPYKGLVSPPYNSLVS